MTARDNSPTPRERGSNTRVRKRPGRAGGVAVFLGVVAVALVVVLAISVWGLLLRPWNDVPSGQPVQIEVAPGATTKEIAIMLAETGVISNPNMFRLQSRACRCRRRAAGRRLRPRERDALRRRHRAAAPGSPGRVHDRHDPRGLRHRADRRAVRGAGGHTRRRVHGPCPWGHRGVPGPGVPGIGVRRLARGLPVPQDVSGQGGEHRPRRHRDDARSVRA